MKKLAIFGILMFSVSPFFGQATSGYHRIGQVIQRAPQGGITAQVVPYATIAVTSTSTGLAANIYSDPLLTAPIPNSTVTADQNGNYDYYMALGQCDTESITYPGGGSITNVNVCSISGGGVTSVSNSDGTLTISPTTGAVIASLNLAHANTWTGKQTQPAPVFSDILGSIQCLTVNASGQVSGTGSPCGGAAGVTSVNTDTTSGISGGPITATGTIACEQSTASQFGCVKPDGTTITAVGGVLSASSGGTPAGSAYSTQYNNAGSFGGTGPGTAGQVLTSNGAGAAPTYQAASAASGTFNRNPATTAIAFVTASIFIVNDDTTFNQSDGFNDAATPVPYKLPVSACTIATNIPTCTYGTVAADPVAGNRLLFFGFTGALAGLNGQIVSVTSAGSGSLVTSAVTGFANGTYTDTGTAANADNAARQFQEDPKIQGHGCVTNISLGGSTVGDQITKLPAIITADSCIQSAITAGSPVHFILMPESNSFSGACPTLSTVETQYGTLMNKLLTDGGATSDITLVTGVAYAGNTALCSNTYQLYGQLNQYLIQNYGPTTGNRTAKTYWSHIVQAGSVFGSTFYDYYNGGPHLNTYGNTILAGMIADLWGIYRQSPYTLIPSYTNSLPSLYSNNEFTGTVQVDSALSQYTAAQGYFKWQQDVTNHNPYVQIYSGTAGFVEAMTKHWVRNSGTAANQNVEVINGSGSIGWCDNASTVGNSSWTCPAKIMIGNYNAGGTTVIPRLSIDTPYNVTTGDGILQAQGIGAAHLSTSPASGAAASGYLAGDIIFGADNTCSVDIGGTFTKYSPCFGSGAGSTAFSAITSGTNTSAAMHVSSTATLTADGGTFFKGTVNPQVGTTYTFASADNGKLTTFSNAASIAVTLPQATTAGFTVGAGFDVQNLGAGTATITPTTSTINGGATLALATGQGAHIVSDGTNYSAQVWTSTAGGSSAFSALTSGTNTTAAMVVGSGASLAPTGTGTIQATNISGTVAAGSGTTVTGSGTTASPYTIAVTGSGPANSVQNTFINAGTTGTTLNTLTKLTGAPSTAVIAATTDTGGVIGVTTAGAGTTGSATVTQSGLVNCVFSNATTAGDYVQISSATAGNCADTGAATYPTSGQVIGRVLSTNASAGTYQIDLFPSEIMASSGGTGSGAWTNITSQISWTGCTVSAGVCSNASTSTSITASSIPSSYSELVIEFTGNNATATENFNIQFNSDTASHYTWARYGYQAATFASATSGGSAGSGIIGWGPNFGNNSTQIVCRILNYTETTDPWKNVTCVSTTNSTSGVSGQVTHTSWAPTAAAAISSFKLFNPSGGGFSSGVTLRVYGVGNTSGTSTLTIASGTAAMGTAAIASGTCATAVTASASGVATTDAIQYTPNTDPTAVTGYGPSATGSLYIWTYPTANNVNFKVCNNTSGSITPGALTLNWRVVR